MGILQFTGGFSFDIIFEHKQLKEQINSIKNQCCKRYLSVYFVGTLPTFLWGRIAQYDYIAYTVYEYIHTFIIVYTRNKPVRLVRPSSALYSGKVRPTLAVKLFCFQGNRRVLRQPYLVRICFLSGINCICN